MVECGMPSEGVDRLKKKEVVDNAGLDVPVLVVVWV